MEQDKKFPSEKVIETFVGLVMALSGLVALFALIWGRWYAFKVSLTIFLVMALSTAFGYYMVDRNKRK